MEMETKKVKRVYKQLVCLHNKRKTECFICGGKSLCIHHKLKYYCKECGGKAYCIHNKESQCVLFWWFWIMFA